eukprot:645129-Pyramimonas_sp.AAC.1
MGKPLLIHAVHMKEFLNQGIAVNNYEQILATPTGADAIKQSTLVIVNSGDSLYIPAAWWWSLTVVAGLRDAPAADRDKAKAKPKGRRRPRPRRRLRVRTLSAWPLRRQSIHRRCGAVWRQTRRGRSSF